MQETLPEGRRYRILDLIGRGGSGHVYRARLEGLAGFTKTVAIKIIRNEDISASAISRFRDEARILGLVRDRAIVGVEPPIRLGGRLALVMEYVDGASCQRLLTSPYATGPVPPKAALEIVQEIARVLHKVYIQPGPDGQPLHLIHRDLKPANIQITPEGDVKVLDFGTARARFESRETRTSGTFGGTFGYIAPERLRGIDGPEADIFSLGVLLHVLVTSERATLLDQELPEDREPRFLVERTPEIERVLQLAARMRAAEPSLRPTARAVEMDCAAIGASLSGPTLRQWAAEAVPLASSVTSQALQERDEMVGMLLTETVEISASSIERKPVLLPASTTPSHRQESARWLVATATLLGVIVGMGALAGMGAGLLVAAATWVWPDLSAPVASLRGRGAEPVEAIAVPPVPEASADEANGDKAGADEVGADEANGDKANGDERPREAPAPEPAPVASASAPDEPSEPPRPERPRPVAAVAPEPAVQAPAQPAVKGDEGDREVEIVGVTFLSDPPGASIYLDGVLVGRTPLRDHPVSSGSYALSLKQDGRTIERTVRLGGRRGSTRFEWRGDQLLAQ